MFPLFRSGRLTVPQPRKDTTVTRKPNFWKCILGIAVLTLMFIGTWAATRAPKTSATKLKPTNDEIIATAKNRAAIRLNALGVKNALLSVPAWDAVFEIDGNAADDVASPVDDWNDFLPGNVSVNTTSITKGSGPPRHADVWTFITAP